MNRKILLPSLLASVLLFPAIFLTLSVTPALADPGKAEPAYVGVAKYYDNRTFAVTMSYDDYTGSHSVPWKLKKWQDMFDMMNSKNLTYTVAVITDYTTWGNNWTLIQENLDDAKQAGEDADTPYLMEVSSHSKTHTRVSAWDNSTAYDEVGGSADQIKGNMTLSGYWKMNGTEYVLSWIEPYGQSSSYTRAALGDYHYLIDRSIDQDFEYISWDSSDGLFERWGVSLCLQGKTVQRIKDSFDSCYTNGWIFCPTGHPAVADDMFDWNVKDGNADEWTNYISGNTSAWYAHQGTLYSYRYIATDPDDAITISSSGSGKNKVFSITVNDTIHERYGLRYPVTHVFDMPADWTSPNVYYRYKTSDDWILMTEKSSSDFFNGINASRFDYINHKAYVSVGFSNVSDEIYLQLHSHQIIHVPHDYSTIQQAINKANPGDIIQVAAGTYYEHVVVNKTMSLIGENKSTTIIDGNGNGNLVLVEGAGITITGFTLRNASIGLYILGFNHTINRNIILDNTYHGIDLVGRNNCISENTITNNRYGIILGGSNYNVISRNTLMNNQGGINLCEDCEDNNIIKNTLMNNTMGIGIAGNNNSVIGNTIKENWSGIEIAGTSNTIYHNNFINNTNQVDNVDSINTWDNGCEGNYWSNYNGTDLYGDGIGDEYLPWEGVDYYPLMSPYMEGDVNHDAIVNIVDIVIVAIAFNSTPGDPKWNPHADLNDDKIINIVDIVIAAIHFGETWMEEEGIAKRK